MTKAPLTKSDWWRIAKFWLVLGFFMTVLLGVVLGPICPPACGGRARMSSAMQNSRTIGMALFQYAQDHQGHYPEGNSSTEIFQQLLDQNYITDPMLFFINAPGKVHPIGNHLKSENVGWDATCCVDQTSSDGLPLVYLTGYKITYVAGGTAVLLPSQPARTWSQWRNDEKVWPFFIAVCYKGNSAKAITPDNDGSIPNFIPADFDPKGKTYRQLTP